MKLHKLIPIAAFVLLMSLLTSCGSDTQAYETNLINHEADEESANEVANQTISVSTFDIQPTFTKINYLPLSLHYAVEADIENRRYLFPTDDEYQNTKFINLMEEAIYLIENIISLPISSSTIIISFSEEDETTIFGQAIDAVLASSRHQLPFWFSSGIEAYIQSNAGLLYLIEGDISDDFGDMSFLPHFWGTTEHETAINTAGNFVKFLSDNGLFDKLVGLYLEEDIRTADQAARTHFLSFAGKPMSESNFRLELRSDDGYLVTQSTEWGEYIFIFNTFQHFFDAVAMQQDIDSADRASEFVAGWYSEHFDFVFVPITHRIYMDSELMISGRYLNTFAAASGPANLIRYSGMSVAFPHAVPHEVSHILEWQIGRDPFITFSEGLANVIWFSFADYIGFDVETIGFSRFDHPWAFWYLDSETYLNPSDLGGSFAVSTPRRFQEISHHVTATSFVQYLIETYGAEKYLQVHWDVDGFDEVFGISIEEMILRWREFLEVYSA